MTHPSEHPNPGKGPDKAQTIYVNGRPKEVTSKELTYLEVIRLAYENPPEGDNVLFTITYRKGQGNKPEGSLLPGDSVHIKDGMVFNVTHTDKS